MQPHMRLQKLMFFCALCTVLAPARAHAEWFASPFIGAAFGGGERLRPYAAGGLGWLRTRIGADDDFIQGGNSNIGLNVGGGVTADLSDRFGLRGDIRYFRDLQALESESEFFSLGRDKLEFWRAAVGVTFRF